MEIQHLRSFLAVASGGGYLRAAVKALERELGIALFERRGRRAVLTLAGSALVEEALTKAGLAYQVGLEARGWEAIKTYAGRDSA
ncbi:MAG: hypothetical protein IPP35_05420 [Elusimicrobia bacterium]|nr:hypothetical protein [Elusimicrobiota bacterium]